MDAPAVFLKQLDDAWAHAWESIESALEGVEEAEAAWQPPAFAAEPVEEGWPLPGTIRWFVAHLAHYKRDYAAMIRARGGPAPEPPSRRPLATYAEERAALDAAHAEEREAFAALDTEALATTVEDARPLPDFLSAVIRHDTWHAGQIALLRRLYRHRG